LAIAVVTTAEFPKAKFVASVSTQPAKLEGADWDNERVSEPAETQLNARRALHAALF
jgi:hypothetical protein